MENDIIHEIWTNPNIESYCKALNYSDWAELRQEFIVQILNMDQKKLKVAKDEGFLEYLCFKIIKRIVLGNIKGTGIFRKNKVEYIDLVDIVETPESSSFEYNISDIMDIVERSHWYDKILFKEYYIEGLNLRQISEKYKINSKSIHYTVNKMRKKIKKNLNDKFN